MIKTFCSQEKFYYEKNNFYNIFDVYYNFDKNQLNKLMFSSKKVIARIIYYLQSKSNKKINKLRVYVLDE